MRLALYEAAAISFSFIEGTIEEGKQHILGELIHT